MTDRWIVFAPERGVRPSDFITISREAEAGPCPFCPGEEALTPPAIHTVPGKGDGWQVRVIPNRFPAVVVEDPLVRSAVGPYDRVSGFGAHEVIVECPAHGPSIWELPDEERSEVLRVYRDRLSDLGNDRRLRWAMVFKNRGAEAGATLIHEHSQLVALPMIPREPLARLEGAAAYYARTERCVHCDVMAFEQKEGVRVVGESRFFLAFCPYASRAPFETWILPKQHASHYAGITERELADLSSLLGRVLRRMDGVLEQPSINWMLHSAPLQEREGPSFHWHLEIVPATQRMGGFEWGAGFFINPTLPEEAARFLAEETP